MIDSIFPRAAVLASAAVSLSLLAAAALPAQDSASGGQTTSATGDDSAIALSPADAQGRYRYMIDFDEPALLDLGSSIKSGKRLNTRAPEFDRAVAEIQQFQAARIDSVNAAVVRTVEVSHHFIVSRNGVAVRLTPQEARQVAQLPAVKSVERERLYALDLFRSGEFIGATSVWDGSSTLDGSELRGEGIIAGVLDSGSNLDHPSFANDPSCRHGEGATPDKLISAVDCSASDAGGRCDGRNPNDTNGHGSHVASTVAGNLLDNSADPSPLLPDNFPEISGIAPCAHIRSYKVCPGDTCPTADLQAGFDTLLLDGDVDVMNYSISGGTNPWNDFDRVKLDIVEAGTFVAASAGNSQGNQSPVGQIKHRGPWVMSVAASTVDIESQRNRIWLEGGPSAVPSNLGTGPRMTEDFIGPLRYSRDVDSDNFESCNPWPNGTFSGEAALISRGTCTFEDKVNNAEAAGAELVIVFNNVPDEVIIMAGLEDTTIPSTSIRRQDGMAMINTLNGGTAEVTVEASFEAQQVPGAGDVLAGFSLRGPTPGSLKNHQKPNITGPGVDIYAARADNEEYNFLSGTSMSGPHVAGAAVLASQAHSTWSPIEVKSALQMTAKKTGFKDDGETAWDWDDVGSGRVELTRALLAGLVMDETIQNFLDANPSDGGDVRTLNLPSVRDVACDPDCTWTRTVRAGQDFPTSWTVSTQSTEFDVQVRPTDFELAEREILFRDGAETGDTLPNTSEQVVEITVSSVTAGDIHFGETNFTEDEDLTPEAHITIAVQNPTVR